MTGRFESTPKAGDEPAQGPEAKQNSDDPSSQLRALSMMTVGIANDVNNHLSAILGNLSLLRRELAEHAQGVAPRLDVIRQAAEQAAELVQRLHSITRHEPRKSSPANVNTIVYHVLLEEEQKLAPRIRIVRHIDPDLWRVAADPGEIAEVVLNVALNAVEAIQGEGRVCLRTRNADLTQAQLPGLSKIEPGRYISLAIEDTGTGIPEEIRARIFEPGYTTKPNHRGMGLNRIHEIVQRYGGRIFVTSAKDHGTVFQVFLPAVELLDVEATKSLQELPSGTETILIVDDEPSVLNITEEILKRLGYTTLVARNGEEALDVVRSHVGAIDLVMLDLVMPVMGGAEAYPLLKMLRPNIKVIIHTGVGRDMLANAAWERLPEVPICLKPFRTAVLAQKLRDVLQESPDADTRQ